MRTWTLVSLTLLVLACRGGGRSLHDGADMGSGDTRTADAADQGDRTSDASDTAAALDTAAVLDSADAPDAPDAHAAVDARNDAPDAASCANATCAAGEVCMQACVCGGPAPPCDPVPDAGSCASGSFACTMLNGRPGCQRGCMNPPPACVAAAAVCFGGIRDSTGRVHCPCAP
jgi:hypothetical protein